MFCEFCAEYRVFSSQINEKMLDIAGKCTAFSLGNSSKNLILPENYVYMFSERSELSQVCALYSVQLLRNH